MKSGASGFREVAIQIVAQGTSWEVRPCDSENCTMLRLAGSRLRLYSHSSPLIQTNSLHSISYCLASRSFPQAKTELGLCRGISELRRKSAMAPKHEIKPACDASFIRNLQLSYYTSQVLQFRRWQLLDYAVSKVSAIPFFCCYFCLSSRHCVGGFSVLQGLGSAPPDLGSGLLARGSALLG